VNSYIMYKDYYKMCVQFINLHLLDYWIHCFPTKS
jgi:hypothetical protein